MLLHSRLLTLPCLSVLGGKTLPRINLRNNVRYQ